MCVDVDTKVTSSFRHLRFFWGIVCGCSDAFGALVLCFEEVFVTQLEVVEELVARCFPRIL